MTNFLGMSFHPILLDCQEELDRFLRRYPQSLCGYTFASLISWAEVFHYEYFFLDQKTMLISTTLAEGEDRHLLQPEGEFSIDCQKKLLQLLKAMDSPMTISGVTDGFLQRHSAFCSHFSVKTDRAMANYVYRVQDLATLAGRRYAKKRNLIAQADSLYSWSVEPLGEGCREDCCHILSESAAPVEKPAVINLEDERKALKFMMDNLRKLNQQGCLIRVEGRPAAFSIWEELRPNMADVHFEKAIRSYKGLYQLINRECARQILQAGYAFVNREDDLDLEGLRQTKLSYYPVELVNYHVLTYQTR